MAAASSVVGHYAEPRLAGVHTPCAAPRHHPQAGAGKCSHAGREFRQELRGDAPVMLGAWLNRWPGRMLLETEAGEFGRILPDLFGFHLLQLGAIGNVDLLEASRIRHRIVLDCLLAPDDPRLAADGYCDPEHLPLAQDAIDVVVLPHVLEFTPDPQQVLREVERVLVSGGHVVITGFNPRSLFGLFRPVLGLWRKPPWNGRFLSLSRLKEWLNVLGFEVLDSRCLVYRPLWRRLASNPRFAALDVCGQWLLPAFGGNYVVVARKSAGAMITLPGRAGRRRNLIPKPLPQPTPRDLARRWRHRSRRSWPQTGSPGAAP